MWSTMKVPSASTGRVGTSGMPTNLSLLRTGFSGTTVVLQRVIRGRRPHPEITSFGLVISVLIKGTHIACFEPESGWRRKLLVDVSQTESEAVAAREVIS